MIDKERIEEIGKRLETESEIPLFESKFLFEQLKIYQKLLAEISENRRYLIHARWVINGFILKIEGGEVEEIVCQNSDGSFDNFKELVHELMDRFIDNGCKYSEKKLYLVEAPGYKSDKWAKIDCPLCFRHPRDDEMEG